MGNQPLTRLRRTARKTQSSNADGNIDKFGL
jgi:hypothetical protein